MSKEAALRAESQLGLVDNMHVHAGFLEFVEKHDRIAHAARDPIERDSVDTVDAPKIDDLAQLPHSGTIECLAGPAFVVKTPAAPVQVRIVEGHGEVTARVDLGFARGEVRQFLNGLRVQTA